jgi:hypothetical protein
MLASLDATIFQEGRGETNPQTGSKPPTSPRSLKAPHYVEERNCGKQCPASFLLPSKREYSSSIFTGNNVCHLSVMVGVNNFL